jgi:hypothetical protein
MPKDASDVVEPVQASSGMSSQTNPPPQTKRSLASAANPAWQDRY